MSILDTVARRLSSANYTITRSGDEVRFEDASILGFISEFPTVRQLLDGWQEAQDHFLRSNASDLRRDRRKSWNVYSIVLTPERASDDQARALVAVEEDFRATRKVARAGISTDRDVENALAVLLPIRHRVSLGTENALGRVADRLKLLPPTAVASLLRDASGEGFVASLLSEEEK